ncbi:MAG: hypothetical protein AAFR04_15270, partial [Pseudomonadota bacterium]
MAFTFLVGLAFVITRELLVGARRGGADYPGAPSGGSRNGGGPDSGARRLQAPAGSPEGAYAGAATAMAGTAAAAGAAAGAGASVMAGAGGDRFAGPHDHVADNPHDGTTATTASPMDVSPGLELPAGHTPRTTATASPSVKAAAPSAGDAGAHGAAVEAAAEPAHDQNKSVIATTPPSPPPLEVTSVERYAELTSVGSLARHLSGRESGQAGFRTLMTGHAGTLDAAAEAVELADELTQAGQQVVLVDWAPSGEGLAVALDMEPSPGMNELVNGSASFEDVIVRLPGGAGHLVPSGARQTLAQLVDDADRLNLVLDALDEAYDHIVVHGSHEDARALFEAIQGRFDAGVTLASGNGRRSVLGDMPGIFLGFEVSDLDIIRLSVAGQNEALNTTQAHAPPVARGGSPERLAPAPLAPDK